MLWPQYGVTPDYGTYGAETNAASEATGEVCEPCGRGGAQVTPLGHVGETATLPDGRVVAATEPPLVNPTASISGMLDKLAAGAGQGRALGRALAAWERLARADDTTVALTLAEPTVAAGLRETLVYATERRYVDVIVAGADDLLADLYESLGHAHYTDDAGVVASDEGRAQTLAFLREFLLSVGEQASSGAALWRALGERLATAAPRKGLLQAAAQAGVALYTPDLSASAVAGALLAAQAGGASLALDPNADLAALAQTLGTRSRLGVIRVGVGLEDSLLARAQETATLLGGQAPALTERVTIDAASGQSAGGAVNVTTDASLALPLLVTGLAQRVPGVRVASAPSEVTPRPVEHALA